MDLTPSGWSLWVVVALAAFGLEVKLNNFLMLGLGAGALASALVAWLGGALEPQLLAWVLVAGASVVAFRTPAFRRLLMRGGQPLRTGTSGMVGREALVVEPLTEAGGSVRINGELWGAHSLEGPIPEGARVLVEQVQGLKLQVRRPLAPVFASVSRKELP